MDTAERDRQLKEQRKARFEADFELHHQPGHTPAPEARIATAAEYSAFQLGRIRIALEQIASLLEDQKKTSP